jgi:hypothetical protein
VTAVRAMARGVHFTALITLLIGAAALILAGCGGKKQTRDEVIAQYGQELRDAVATDVSDESRKAKMLLIVDQLQALQVRFSQETGSFIRNYRQLDADYAAPRAAFEQLFAGFNAQRVKARGEALDLHFQLAALATDGEWRAIGKAETKMYEELEAARPTEVAK